MRVHEYAKQAGKDSSEVLNAIDEINGMLDGEQGITPISAGSPQSGLEDEDLERLNSYFGLEPQPTFDEDESPKLIPLYEFQVHGIRLKGKGPGIIRESVVANDESEANRQVIVKRGLKGHYYKFQTKRGKSLGDHYRPHPKAELIPAPAAT